ncbi:MAG: RNA polymerase sigma factor [Muribaculaceae bacterium]|nr:RNA polymerase sigma factor [Muribaculaceae bacterium]
MEKDALTSSFVSLRDKLHRIAMSYLKSDADADDTLHDAWLRLRERDDVKSDPEARNKLIAVVRNLCIDRLRKAPTISIDSVELTEFGTGELETEDVNRLEHLLSASLTPLQHRIFNLYTHEGMEYDEIAELLSLSVEAVRMNMSRARKRMREIYKKLNA